MSGFNSVNDLLIAISESEDPNKKSYKIDEKQTEIIDFSKFPNLARLHPQLRDAIVEDIAKKVKEEHKQELRNKLKARKKY
jgi:hypothetical protein